MNEFSKLHYAKENFFGGVVLNRQSNIVPPPTTTTKSAILKLLYKGYIQIPTRGQPGLHISSLHIPHGLWTPHGKVYTLTYY